MSWEKEKYCQDLTKFAEVITKHDDTGYISGGLGALYRIAGQIQKGDSLRHEIEDVVLTIHKKISGTVPIEVRALSINIGCICDIDVNLDPNKHDIIKEYSLQLEIIGYTDEGQYLNCWHLDKDIPPSNGGIHNHTHPSYHFQSGGRRVEELNTGQLLLLGAPRLPHPPMDIFLAIHFVINNFFGKSDYIFLESLFDDPDYQDILARAKQRMFVPYFQAFKEGCTHQDFNVGKIFPLAV